MYTVQDYNKTAHPVIHVRFDIFLTCGKYLYDSVISLRGQVWIYKTNLLPSHFIEEHVPSKRCERSCISVLFGSVLSLFLWLNFGTIPIVLYIFLGYFSLYYKNLLLSIKHNLNIELHQMQISAFNIWQSARNQTDGITNFNTETKL